MLILCLKVRTEERKELIQHFDGAGVLRMA